MRAYPGQSLALLDPQDLSDRITSWVHGNLNLAVQQQEAAQPPSPDSSPASLLPPELLSEIFLFCLPEQRFPIPSKTTAPLLLTQVCKAWRDISLCAPQLWSGVHLNYRSAVEDVPAMHLWLSRSGDRPLSLSLSIDFNEQPHQAILNLLCRYAPRWKHIQFEFQRLSCPPMYHLDRALDNVPMLSTFEFHARDISTSNVLPITRLLSSAPALKELAWVDDLADTGTLLSLPLSRLARLSLSMNYGSLDYIELLDQCANLEHIRITRPGPDIRSSRDPLLLPKLASLNIAHDLTGILDHLILPSLRHIRVHVDAGSADDGHQGRSASRGGAASIFGLPASSWAAALHNEGDDNRRKWDPTFLIQLIERSSCRIESLWINAPMSDNDLVACLKACEQSLKSVTIHGALSYSSCSALVQILTPSQESILDDEAAFEDDTPCFFPRLTELSIDTRIPNACSLVDMVQRRMGLGPPQPTTQSSPSPLPRLHVLPFKCLRLQYPAGHKDISTLRDIAAAANSLRRDALDLRIVESRMGNLRGSSAGRSVRPYMFRRKVCASR